jgi:hypothetical protein
VAALMVRPPLTESCSSLERSCAVFGDGVSEQLVQLVGDPTTGYSGAFQVGVAL